MSVTPPGGEPAPRPDLSAERRRLLQLLEQERKEATAQAVSSPQERFWFLEQLEPGNPAHHVAGSSMLRGPLDQAALQRATSALVRRHEQLRASFPAEDGRPRIVVADELAVPLPLHDLRELTESARAEARQRLRDAIVLSPFSLHDGPLFRQCLLQLEDSAFELLWCFHHIVVDGLSMAVLAQECASLYQSERTGQSVSLEPVRSYREHAYQQRGWLQSDRCRQLEAEWSEHLAQLPPLDVATPLGADAGQPLRGQRTVLPLDLEASQSMLAAARALQLTPFQWFLAGFATLLHRCSGATDFAIGTPVAGREADFANVVGFFVNSLVLRIDCSNNPSFGDLAERIRRECLWAYDRPDLPFERLVETLDPQRHPERHPVFQVMCNHVAFTPPERFGDLQQEYRELPSGSLLALTFYIRRQGERIQLELEYDARRFSETQLEGWLRAIRVLLVAAAQDPAQRLAELPLLTQPLADSLRQGGAGPALPTVPWTSLAERVLAQCEANPDRIAVQAESSTLLYRDLAHQTRQLSAGLRALGATGGQRIAVHVGRDLDLLPLLLAVLHTGCCYVPLPLEQPTERHRQILAAAQPLFVVSTASPIEAASPEVRTVSPGEIRSAATGQSDDAAQGVDPEQAAYLLFTSGSTGKPKGVTVPHRAALSFLHGIAQTLSLERSDQVLAITSLGFDIALLELFAPLLVGGSVRIADSAATGDPALFASLLANDAVTVAQATPTTWRLLQRHGFPGRDNLRMLAGGEPLPADLAAFLRSRCQALWNLYGPTETTVWSAAWPVPADFAPGHAVRIGRALPGQFLRVLDAHGQPLPPGTVGELAIGGCGLATGYLDDPVATEERFRKDPLGPGLVYLTGDRARLEEDGSFSCLGRIDDQLKVHGYRLEPGEVEAALRKHPASAVAAVDLRGEGEHQRLCAWLVAEEDATPSGPSAQVASWTEVWDATYAAADASATGSDDWDLAGWNDRGTGASLPPGDMRSFYEAVLGQLRRLAPSRVLELGCGTGQLLLGLAEDCQQYVGLDVSATAIGRLQALANARNLPAALHCAEAVQLAERLPAGAQFDLVVLNSVVQYFPDLTYLLQVIEQASQCLAPGGTLFLGDIRWQPLQAAACASIALTAASDQDPAIAAHASQLADQDRELLLDREFFEALVAQHPRLTGLRIRLHEHAADDELTRFRANVSLHADVEDVGTPQPVDTQQLAEHLGSGPPDAVVEAAGVLEPRSAPWVFLAEQLASHPEQSSDELHRLLARRQEECRAHRDAAWWAQYAERHGRDLEIRPGKRPGTMDLLARPWRPTTRSPSAGESADAWDPTAFAQRQTRRLASATPNHTASSGPVATAQLREHLQKDLPAPAIPSAYAWVVELPRSPNGKLLRRELEDPRRPRTTGLGGPPTTPLERLVAAAFAEVLDVENPGAQDDFFSLGGHSLLATRVTARLQERSGRRVALLSLFQSPTVAGLARAMEQAAPEGSVEPPRLAADAPKPLLLAHERIWFLQRLDPRNSAYHLAGLVSFDAPVP
ncbi:MAG: amino acid adenylation domain-containing protein, partial [Planctomycetota bacterium]|nr:amino acid adenylation domain-containing protein [Planctomycetota bacterium]